MRRILWDHLASSIDASEPTIILNEIPLQSGSAVIDVAVINHELVGYEIKSAVDSLRRLTDQVELYRDIFDRLYVVTIPRKATRVQALIPRWCGIILIDDALCITTRHPARKNRRVVVEVVLDLLTRTELVGLAKRAGLRGYSADTKAALCERLCTALGDAAAKEAVRTVLRERKHWTPRQLRKPSTTSASA